ncbi:MAG: exodeoxyribonuclease VII small subunit [Candidatus Methanomethylophilaceae archaeon]|jgi:exodeoxyribonuclease VII small subunit|nr:exodeoxyribonuclease VII small subunit [Candidatus Methanomethylophilaceae archaeon]
MTEEKRPEEMTFEESLNKLNELVNQLENGGLDLDKNIEIYEQAVVLRDRCRKILEESERKVQKLMETADGIKKEDFSVE